MAGRLSRPPAIMGLWSKATSKRPSNETSASPNDGEIRFESWVHGGKAGLSRLVRATQVFPHP